MKNLDSMYFPRTLALIILVVAFSSLHCSLYSQPLSNQQASEASIGLANQISPANSVKTPFVQKAQQCLQNIMKIEKLIALWESKHVILKAQANKSALIDSKGKFLWDGNEVDLGLISENTEIFSCPENQGEGKPVSDHSYQFFNTDNSSEYILGTANDIGGRGVVCNCEINGKRLGKLNQLGLDNTKESAHHH